MHGSVLDLLIFSLSGRVKKFHLRKAAHPNHPIPDPGKLLPRQEAAERGRLDAWDG